MIVSSSVLNNAVQNYKKVKNNRENYSDRDYINGSDIVSSVAASIILVIAIIFFIMELMVIFYAVRIAIVCTKSRTERIVHLVLAITFTLPYMLLNVLFNDCAKSTLQQDN